jgi:hypothetical protein
MMPMALNLNQRRYVETVLAGLPHLAEAVAAIPPDWQSEAFQAAERSYLKAFRQLELSGPQTWTSSVMRRLRRRVREAEKEKLTKLYERLSANEHGTVSDVRQGHGFDAHLTASSEERKSVARALSADEQIGQTHIFATEKAASSEEQKNVGGEFCAVGKIDQAHSFITDEEAPSEEQNVVGELSTDEQIGHAHGFATSSREQKNVGGELHADEQIGQTHGFATGEATSSEKQKVVGEPPLDEENVARESVKKDGAALRIAEIMIKVEQIFDDGRRRR